MRKITPEDISRFTSVREIAVIGASRNPKKFGHIVYKHLCSRGYSVYPVNPYVDTLLESKCYRSVNELPSSVEAVIVVAPKKKVSNSVKELFERGIRNFWFQKGAEDIDSILFLQNSGANVVYGQCIFMYTSPRGIHKFHAGIARLTGSYIGCKM